MLRGICKGSWLAIAFAWILATSTSFGALVTVEIAGFVDVYYEMEGFEFDGSIENGVPMLGLCTYDSDAPDQSPGPYGGWYAVISVSVEVGNYVFYNDPLGRPQREPMLEVHLGGDGGAYLVSSPGCWFDGLIYVNGSPRVFNEDEFSTGMFFMNLVASDPGYVPDDSLPTSFPPISVFDSERSWGVSVSGVGGVGWLSMAGEITDIRVVPEPACAALLLTGVVFLRRKK